MSGNIFALTVYNNELVAGGQFTAAGGVSAYYIAKWNGTNWSEVGTSVNSDVYALTVFNGALIAAGAFTTAGGNNAKKIARWNGTNWAPLGPGFASRYGHAALAVQKTLRCLLEAISQSAAILL
jgi:hypothetical protein